ncbi:hypothetical protein [Rosenbergiella nectarea]|uniref:hypothetical protein n=1 Tax=Rosenbergiella nectarea TaxID=988801 RepID=UPI001BDA18B9|nr:hypothetical protein [Rosenbergiella nectarea]MBT0731138.1 hypothetical protein [Rosenbergiella nectarea subsp. apis]
MTISHVKRYAEDISVKNEIYNFNELLPNVVGLSAISWEWPGYSRRKHGEQLLKEMYIAINNNISDGIHSMMQLVPEQPDTKIVNYKKTWGLIKNSGVQIDLFLKKESFIDSGISGLVLTGYGYIPTALEGEVQKLIDLEEKIFFSTIPPKLDVDVFPQEKRLIKWLHIIFNNDGIVLFILGRFDENDAEVVAVGRKSVIDKII